MTRPLHRDTEPKRTPRAPRGLTRTGTDLATKPDPKKTSDHIAEVSKNARITWFALLGYLAFAVLTLISFTDQDFFKANAAVKLPFVGTDVPPILYIWLAPPLLLAVHIYLHVHLMKLWAALPRLAAHFRDSEKRADELSEHVYPWLIADFALRQSRQPLLQHHALSRFADVATGFLAWIAVPLTLGSFWLRSMPVHNPWLTTMLGLMMLLAVYASVVSFLEIMDRLYSNASARTWSADGWLGWARRKVIVVLLPIVVSWLSVETTIGLTLAVKDSDGQFQTLVVPINLRLAELSERPGNWPDYDTWVERFEPDFRRRADIEIGAQLTPEQRVELIFEALARRAREIALFKRPDFSSRRFNRANFEKAYMAGINLQNTDLSDAVFIDSNLESADLRLAKLPGATFTRAQMQVAILSRAQMQVANFRQAKMQGADLSGAELQGAKLDGAEMHAARFIHSKMQGASLDGANMRSADFSRADMQGASHIDADMQGAGLNQVRMEQANLSRTRMHGADLFGAQLQGADLSWTEMQGADLRGAMMHGANCESATFRGALVLSAILTCNNLTQQQLELAVGDFETVLLPGLTVASCLESLPRDVEAALTNYAEEAYYPHPSRAFIRDALLCDRDADGNLIEQSVRLGRLTAPEN